MSIRSHALLLAAALSGAALLSGCSTAPKAEDRQAFIERANSATQWFESRVTGLSPQIERSAGYIIFPDVGQFGIIFGGGTFGRGALCRPDGTQIGWAALNRGSFGLQAGVQGFKMLLVLESPGVLRQFMENKLTGSLEGQAVVGEVGGSSAASFTNGVAAYQGANTGLMAGISVGLKYIRYEPLASGERPIDTR